MTKRLFISLFLFTLFVLGPVLILTGFLEPICCGRLWLTVWLIICILASVFFAKHIDRRLILLVALASTLVWGLNSYLYSLGSRSRFNRIQSDMERNLEKILDLDYQVDVSRGQVPASILLAEMQPETIQAVKSKKVRLDEQTHKIVYFVIWQDVFTEHGYIYNPKSLNISRGAYEPDIIKIIHLGDSWYEYWAH